MEAMAKSLPVVVTRVGGVAELVCDGVDGLLVPPKNPPAMAEAIQRLLGDPDLSARMGQAGAKRVRQSFGSHVSAGVIAARLGVRSSRERRDRSSRRTAFPIFGISGNRHQN